MKANLRRRPKKKLIRGEPHNSWLDQLKLNNQIDLITL